MKLVSAGLRATRSRLSYANVMATLAAVAAIGGGAIAAGAIPDEEGEINACYVKRGEHKGEVRLLVRGKCERGEKFISWSQVGPQGEIGLQGAQGQQGPQGETGPSTGPAGGALAGSYPNPTLNVSGGPCANGKALTNLSALAALTCAPGVYSDASNNVAVVPTSPFGALTSGADNSALGQGALDANTTGFLNSALGQNALGSNTTGPENSAFGQGALEDNTTGSSNSALGTDALAANTTGDNNSALGQNALFANTTANDNSALGQGALDANSTGTRNSAFGQGALGANTTASDNAAFGQGALDSNTAGASNSAFGKGALGTNTTALNNSAFGTDALALSSANDNSAFGQGALDNNTSGTRNSAFGQDALGDNNTASDNTAVGEGALDVSSGATGGSNSAFGQDALGVSGTGGSNSAFGQGALDASTAGGSNTAVGANALGSVNTGASNTAVGQGAGTGYTLADSSNIAIKNNGTSGESNTIRIGTQGTGAGQQSRAFLAGVRDVTTTNAAIPVLVDTVGQLGTTSSSRRFKTDITPIGSASDRLMRLRPVSFRYRQSHASGRWPLQYGLIAEQVESIYPELVVDGRDGRPYTVAYQQLPPLLLAQAQREHARTSRLRGRIDRQQREIERLGTAVAALERRGHR